MIRFRQWLETHDIPAEAIKVALPPVRQQTTYSCGAQAFRAICLYFGVGPKDEKDYIKMLGSNAKDGTWPESIIKHAKHLGMKVQFKTGMTTNELKRFLDQGIPVICSMQAWGTPKQYQNAASGHYVVAVGYDEQNLYFEDPSIDNKRGFLKYEDFDKRWHDKDCHGHDCDHLGIAIWGSNPAPRKKGDKAKHIE